MQETLLDKQANDGPISAIDKLEKTSVKKHDKQYPAVKIDSKTSSATAGSGDVDASEVLTKPETLAMGDVQNEDIRVNNKKEKKDKEKTKMLKERNENDSSSIEHAAKEGFNGNGEKDSRPGQHADLKNGESDKMSLNSSQHDNNSVTGIHNEKKATAEKTNGKMPSSFSAPTVSAPAPPIMRGTLSLDPNANRHLIRGMWNYENSNALPAQRFELVRNLDPDEDKNKLPIDGVFHGSFSLAYLHMTSKGKQKERSKVIQETGVEIKFKSVEGSEEFIVEGKGTNQFGVFFINGTATPSRIPDDNTLAIVLRKRYETIESTSSVATEPVNNDTSIQKPGKIKKVGSSTNSVLGSQPSTAIGLDQDNNTGPLPEATKSFASGVVALRGNLYVEESTELGLVEVVHRINGMWAAGLDLILADPQNVQGFCNRFEYEHKSSSHTQQFPVSGRYSGWFEISNEDATRTRVNERDVTLKFKLNNAGYHNVEGKGSNVFGKYTITGTLTLDKVLTIFRVFLPRKIKTKSQPVNSEAGVSGTIISDASRRLSVGPSVEPKLKLTDVDTTMFDPDNVDEPYNPIKPPANGEYSAVSQGVLRVNDDGSHSCQGKWAVTREHFTNSSTSNFNFRLESHHAQEAVIANKSNLTSNGEPRLFPLDSSMYKGSFQMKKQGSRYQTVVDDQIVMKFRENKNRSYNVYGTGINSIGEFNLLGTLVMSGKAGGQVELYRIYKPSLQAVPIVDISASTDDFSGTTVPAPMTAEIESSWSMGPPNTSSNAIASILPVPPERSALSRRESSRMSKLPSRLEEDDPSAQLSRIMEKCAQVLKFIREKDIELGAFFCEPVDPLKLGIPTYYQVIKEPMDLRTVQRNMDLNEIKRPEEFMRLVRLVFENAMTFNIDPSHSVHKAARSLLFKFNDKIRDVERLVQTIRRSHGPDDDGKGKKKRKDEKKRKRHTDEPKSLKRQRLDEVEVMVTSNVNAFAAIAAAAPLNTTASVTRAEFNLLLDLVKQLHGQIVQTHTALAELLPGDTNEGSSANVTSNQSHVASAPAVQAVAASTTKSNSAPPPAPAQEKRLAKRKSEPLKPSQSSEDDASLSKEEKIWLEKTINELPCEYVRGVIQIIGEADPELLEKDDKDEEGIEIEINQMDHRTQRKLVKYVLKYAKKSKPKPKKKLKTQVQQPKKSSEKVPPKKPKSPIPKPAATTESFFSYGNKSGSDSDTTCSDEGDSVDKSKNAGKKDQPNEFEFSSGINEVPHDDDDDLLSVGVAGDWAEMSEPARQDDEKDDENDYDWAAAAREQAAANKARDADRKAREEKKKKEAEETTKKAMAEAAKRKEELLAKKAEEKEKEAFFLEQQEKEAERAREAAREQARAENRSVTQSFDMEGQRELMKQIERSYLENDSTGGASPSSDFEF